MARWLKLKNRVDSSTRGLDGEWSFPNTGTILINFNGVKYFFPKNSVLTNAIIDKLVKGNPIEDIWVSTADLNEKCRSACTLESDPEWQVRVKDSLYDPNRATVVVPKEEYEAIERFGEF